MAHVTVEIDGRVWLWASLMLAARVDLVTVDAVAVDAMAWGMSPRAMVEALDAVGVGVVA